MSSILKGTEMALPQLPAGWQLVTAAVLADGTLALLATDIDLAHEAVARAKARLWCFDGERLLDGPSFVLETPFPCIDRFDDGRWLVVARRTGSEPNARLLAPDGQLLARFMLGDGIAHVGVDRHGLIWVGWFDEGVFGNDGWRVPNEERAPSSQGIGLFSADGDYQKLSAFPESLDIIADCYALNIADDGAWICPYTDFPLLQLQPNGPVRWWSNESTGPKALAVSQGNILLAGGYRSDANRLVLITLDEEGNGGAARTVATWRLPLMPRLPQQDEHPDVAARHPWQHPTLLAGRGDTIHLVLGGMWHRWRVSDALTAV